MPEEVQPACAFLDGSGAHCAQILAGLQDTVVFVGCDGIIHYCNRGEAASWVGIRPGTPVADLLPLGERERLVALQHAVLESGQPAHFLHVRHLAPDGERVWDVLISRIMGDGLPLGLVFAARDVTESERAARALRESERQYVRLFDAIPAAVLLVDPDRGAILASNNAAVELFGYGRGEMATLGIGALSTGRGGERPLADLRLDGSGTTSLRWLFRRGGERFHARVTVAWSCWQGAEVLLVQVQDLTLLDELQASLDRSRDQLLLKNELMEQKNTALRELVEQVQMERERVGDRVRVNVERLVLPVLDRLQERLRGPLRAEIDLLRASLDELTSSFCQDLTQGDARLSPREVEICGQIRHGRSSKEIGSSLGIALREKSLTDKLLNAQRDTVFLFDPATGAPIRWNRQFEVVSGYSAGEIARSIAPAAYYDAKDLALASEAIARSLADGEGLVELTLVTRDGARIPFEYAVTVVEGQDGTPLLLSIGRDVSERKRAERDLAERLAELERWHDVMLGREDRVLELKREVNALCRRVGEPARYTAQDDDGAHS